MFASFCSQYGSHSGTPHLKASTFIDTISFIRLVLKGYCVCVGGGAHVCTGMWKPEVNLVCHCSGAFYLAFRDRASLLPEDRWWGWLSSEPQVSNYCCCPGARIGGMHVYSSIPSSCTWIHPTSSSIMFLDLGDGDPDSYFYKCVTTMDQIWWIWESLPTRGLDNSKWVKPLR